MKGTIITIPPSGGEIVREILQSPTLDMLKDAIGGGYLEVVPFFTRYPVGDRGDRFVDCVVFCDEEGKQKGLQYNDQANRAWAECRGIGTAQLGDHLVGPIAVVYGDREFMEAL